MKICYRYPRELLHHDNQLKKRCFRKLKDNVWENKTKWQLLVKAEWSYRYKLLSSSFRPWLTFTKKKIRQRKNIQKADNHYAKKITYEAFLILKLNAEKRWIVAERFRNSRDSKVKRKIWNYWKKYVRKIMRAKEVEALTVKTRELHLLKSYLRLWLIKYNEKVSSEKKYKKAATHSDLCVKRNVVRNWKNYLKCRKKKKQLLCHFLKERKLKMKERAFGRLMQYTAQKKLYREHIKCITSFYENYLLKNVLNVWNTRYEDLVELRNNDKNLRAVKMRDAKLLIKCFRRLKIWTEQQNVRIIASETFSAVSGNLKIQFYLEQWRKILQEALFSKSMELKAVLWRSFQIKKMYLLELVELLEKKKKENRQLKDFIKDFNFNMINKAFRQWLRYIGYRRVKKFKIQEIRYYYESRIVKKFFWKLKYYSAHKNLKNSAVKCYEKRLLSKAFRTLKLFSKTRKFYRSQIADFQGKLRRNLLLRAFYTLKCANTNAKIKLRNARITSENKVKKKVLLQWKIYHERKRRSALIWTTNQTTLQNIIIHKAILTWWKNTEASRAFKEDLKKVKISQENRLVKKYFKKWLDIREKLRLIKEKYSVFSNLYPDTILQYYISKLISLWKERRNVREKRELALVVERGILSRRYFQQWVSYVNWKKEKLRECSAKAGFSLNEPDQIYTSYCCSNRSRRKKPMIPLYLKEEFALSAHEESLSLQAVLH